MPKWSMFSRKKKSKKALDRGEMQAGEQAAGVPLGNQELNAQLQAELKEKLPPQVPAFDADETQKDTAGDAADEPADAADRDTSTATSKEPLSNLYNALKTSKRGGYFHRHSGSEKYEEVMSTLRSINAAVGQRFSADSRSNLEQVRNLETLYRMLLTACEAYTDRFAPITDKGKYRRHLVEQIRELACQDLVGLSEVRMELRSMPEEKQEGKSWREIVENARMVHLKVKDFSKFGKAEGGQASEVLKIKDNGGDDSKGTGVRVQNADGSEKALTELHFFKPEDEFDLSQKTIAGKIVNKILERFPMVSENEKEVIRQSAMASDEPKEPEGLSENGKLAFAAVKMNVKGAKVTYDELLTVSGIADEGGKINMTKRNVATSRMAALIGLEHLVAKSQEVEIFDEATNRTLRGNLMEKAEGMQMRDEFTRAYKEARGKGTAVRVSGSAQRDIVNLQVLDVLCGQMDRHSGNIMVKLDRQTPVSEENPLTGEETITGIQGIDNDAAFGTNTDVLNAKDRNRHDRRVYDPETGKMTLPYMDKNLAERILELRPEVVRFALTGLITEPEIDAALQRLKLMQKAIRNTSKEQFLEDDQWNDETAYTMFKQNWESEGKLYNQQDAERDKLLAKAIPEIFNKKPGERTDEERQIYNKTKGEITNKLRGKYNKMYASKNNYFGRIMLESMGIPGREIWGDAPEKLW